LTASTEGSPRPADQWSGHEGREAYQHRMVCAEILENSCACSRKSAFRDKGAATRILRGRKGFHRSSAYGSARNSEKDLHGIGSRICTEDGRTVAERKRAWKRGFLEDMEVGRRRIGIKASRPHVVSSLFSTLSDGLRESCVSVTKLIFVSIVSSHLFLPSLRLSRSSHSFLLSHSLASATVHLP
jgi:hypothetical protein